MAEDVWTDVSVFQASLTERVYLTRCLARVKKTKHGMKLTMRNDGCLLKMHMDVNGDVLDGTFYCVIGDEEVSSGRDSDTWGVWLPGSANEDGMR